MTLPPKPLVWIGSCLDDLRRFPDDVRQVFGFALHIAQTGAKHPDAKPLKGFGGSGVLEIVEDLDGKAYRAVYTVKLEGTVYALHAFEKKSTRGIKTSKADVETIKRRLQVAKEIHAQREAEIAKRKAPPDDDI